MKYIVAPGVCFSNRGKNLEAGAEITADVFDPQSAFDKFVKQGKIIPVITIKGNLNAEFSYVEISFLRIHFFLLFFVLFWAFR
jgi:hypothetical protein